MRGHSARSAVSLAAGSLPKRIEPVLAAAVSGKEPGRAARRQAIRTPELPADVEFLARQGLPPRIPELAACLAAARNTAARQELFAMGFDPRRYWSMLADDLGLRFAPGLAAAKLVAHSEFLTTEAVRHATAVLVQLDGEQVLIRAPSAADLPGLRQRLRETPALAERILIAAPETIRDFLVRHRHHVLSHYAVNRLADTLPRFSARWMGAGTPAGTSQTLASVGLGLLLLSPTYAAHALFILSAALFTNCSFWKLAAAFHVARPLRLEPLPDAALPTYSVLVPLYREASVVPALLHHLNPCTIRRPSFRSC